MAVQNFKILASLVIFVFVQGCAGLVDTMDSVIGVGQISVEEEVLDGTTTVRMTPAFLTDNPSDYGLNSFKLGARWNSDNPDSIVLEPNFDSQVGGNAYTSFDSLTVRVDGESRNFERVGRTNLSSSSYNSVSNTIYTESSGFVPVPYSLLEQMVEADDVRLRVNSSDGYEDALFSVDRTTSGQGLARMYLRDFLETVGRFRQ